MPFPNHIRAAMEKKKLWSSFHFRLSNCFPFGRINSLWATQFELRFQITHITSAMRPQVRQLQRLEGLACSKRHQHLLQNPRYVHQSLGRDVSLPTSSTVSASSHLISTRSEPHQTSTKTVTGRLSTSTVLHSYLITAMSLSPMLLSIYFSTVRRMLG